MISPKPTSGKSTDVDGSVATSRLLESNPFAPERNQMLNSSLFPPCRGWLSYAWLSWVLVEDRLEGRDEQVRVRVGEYQRRAELNYVVKRTIRPRKDSTLPETVADIRSFLGCRLSRCAVPHKI